MTDTPTTADVDAYLDSIPVMTADELRRRWPASAERLGAEAVTRALDALAPNLHDIIRLARYYWPNGGHIETMAVDALARIEQAKGAEAATRALDADRLSIALQRGGAVSPSHMTYHDLARCVLAALTDGRDDLGAPDEHDRHTIRQAKGAERCVVCAHSMDEHRTPGSECIHARCTCDLSEDIVREFVKGAER